MTETLFGGVAPWFTLPALVGTLVFLLKAGATLVGGDADAPGGGAADLGDANADSSADAFKLLSVQSIAAFLMGFGWVGLAAYRGAGLAEAWSMALAVAAGCGMAYALAWMFAALYRLQSSGNVTTASVVGHEADVDVRVPASRGGTGQVRVVIRGSMRSYHAVTDDGTDLERNKRVLVMGVNADNTLTVSGLGVVEEPA